VRDAVRLRALIADDEPLVRSQLKRLLGTHNVDVVAECGDGEAALREIAREKPDAVFLDIQMPQLDGLETAQRIAAVGGPSVVFVTAYDQHAIAALRAKAVDYLLKPIDPVELQSALERIRARVEQDRAMITRLIVRSRSGIAVVDLSTVDRILSDGNYVMVYAGVKGYSVRRTLASIEAQLDPRRFARAHRSAILNLSCVREVQPWFRGEYVAVLSSGARVRIGASYRDAFLARVETAAR
jgi:two-component system LytT family response regulator